MSRVCLCCASEYVGQVSAMIEAGEPLAAIARQFGLSEDSLQRHKKHMHKPSGAGYGLRGEWDEAYKRALDLHKACAVKGDERGAISALARSVEILEKRSRLVSLDRNSFESLSLQERAERVLNDPDLMVWVIDGLIARANIPPISRTESRTGDATAWKGATSGDNVG